MNSAILGSCCGVGFHGTGGISRSSRMSVSSRVAGSCVGIKLAKKLRAVEVGRGRGLVAVKVGGHEAVADGVAESVESGQLDSVNPSEVLTMLFQAEGSMNETAIPLVTKALEEVDGVNLLKVQVLEGIASVELTKETTIQETGIASSLVERIQGSGFKLQTLNLSFEDGLLQNATSAPYVA